MDDDDWECVSCLKAGVELVSGNMCQSCHDIETQAYVPPSAEERDQIRRAAMSMIDNIYTTKQPGIGPEIYIDDSEYTADTGVTIYPSYWPSPLRVPSQTSEEDETQALKNRVSELEKTIKEMREEMIAMRGHISDLKRGR